jgi:hypothetical protein
MRRGKRAILTVAVLVLGLLAGLLLIASLLPVDRALDRVPIESAAAFDIEPGGVKASFEIDTGGDSLSLRRHHAGLVFAVRTRSKSYRQTIASCAEVGHGSALGSGAPDELDVAVCDGDEYRLLAAGPRVFVERRTSGGRALVSEIRVPADAPSRGR